MTIDYTGKMKTKKKTVMKQSTLHKKSRTGCKGWVVRKSRATLVSG